jgi:hypothetical protein
MHTVYRANQWEKNQAAALVSKWHGLESLRKDISTKKTINKWRDNPYYTYTEVQNKRQVQPNNKNPPPPCARPVPGVGRR